MIFDNLTLLGLAVAVIAGSVVVRAGMGAYLQHANRRRKSR
ncbi:hypothetical protein [Endothiovibrio diazotrophicus]